MDDKTYTIRTMARKEVDLAVEWPAQEGWNPGLYTFGFVKNTCLPSPRNLLLPQQENFSMNNRLHTPMKRQHSEQATRLWFSHRAK